ncbi:MAG: ATP-binding protein [Candidatus Kerfeldbacteria bacterium]|nr:ATP-binding protein [Candidatus Kerfeldbacteria bacterium]
MGRKKIPRYIFDDQADPQARVERTLRIIDCEEAVRALPEVLQEAYDRKLSHLDFINLLLDPVMHKREAERVERWQKQARFPWLKTLESYNFKHPDFIDEAKVKRLAQCDWIDNGANVIFFGPSGVGKTHLSIALGLEAINRGYETRFVTVDRLTEMISVAMGKDKNQGGGENRKKLLSGFANVKLLILDELAYSKIDQEVSDFLFHLICRRYDLNTSTIFTSNEGLMEWDKFFLNNKARAMAAIDRILRDCVDVNIRGKSFRSAGLQLSNYRKPGRGASAK